MKKLNTADGIAEYHNGDNESFSPLIESYTTMTHDAFKVADIIEYNHRSSLNIADIMESMNLQDFIPDCARDDVNLDIMDDEDNEQNDKPIVPLNAIPSDRIDAILETKRHCDECPLRLGCLAVSMTQPKISPNRKSEPTLPLYPGAESPMLVMSEYMMFGKYTPQEREYIFMLVSSILELKNDWLEGTQQQDWDDVYWRFKRQTLARAKQQDDDEAKSKNTIHTLFPHDENIDPEMIRNDITAVLA